MRKKIAILTYSLCGGGAERTVANLLKYLDKEKYDIHLVLMNTDIDYEIPPNQVIHYIEKSSRTEAELPKLLKLPFLAYRFARYCRKENIELVFAVMNRPNIIATMAKHFGLKAKVLISEQFYTPYLYNNNSLAGRFKTGLLKKYYAKADCILPNSRGTIVALRDDMKIDTAYQLLKNPTDVEAIKKLSRESITAPIDFNKFTFINVAAFRPEKNHDLIIEAVHRLRERDFQLIFIGKGILMDKLKEKVNSLGLDKKIIFIPFTDNPFKYLYQSNCFLLSSFVEGFPNILIESMICNLPIIAVDCKTGPRELIAEKTDLNTVIPAGKYEMAGYGILCAVNSVDSFVSAMTWALDNPRELKKFMDNSATKSLEFGLQEVTNNVSLTIDKYLAG